MKKLFDETYELVENIRSYFYDVDNEDTYEAYQHLKDMVHDIQIQVNDINTFHRYELITNTQRVDLIDLLEEAFTDITDREWEDYIEEE